MTATEWAWTTGVSGSELLVLLALAHYADSPGETWPSVAVLGRMVRREPRNVQRMIRSLERRGLIAIIERGGGGKANRYAVGPSVADDARRSSDIMPGLLNHRVRS